MLVSYAALAFRVSATVLLLATAMASQASAASIDEFQRQAYIGLGSGVANLQPVADDGDELPFDDATAPKVLTLGRDFTPRLSAELQVYDLGESRSAAEPVSYRDLTLSAVMFLSHRERRGFSLYGRLGIGDIDNQADVRIQRDHEVRPIAGFGLEVASAAGLAARVEYAYHDSDASSGTLSFLYRFGRPLPARAAIGDTQSDPLPASAQTSSEATPAIVTKALAADSLARPRPLDTTDKTIAQTPAVGSVAAQASTGAGEQIASRSSDPGNAITTWVERRVAERAPADRRWCPVGADFTMTVLGCSLSADTRRSLTFASGSAKLTDAARQSLNRIAVVLRNYPQLTLNIRAHTDDRGDARANVALGARRVRAVASWLIASDVPVQRISGRSYGGSRPIASNATAAGRRFNRRVELVLSRPGRPLVAGQLRLPKIPQ